MVEDTKKQDREQGQATRQTRIKAAVADFYRNGLPALQARRARPDEQQKTLFKDRSC